MVEWSKVNAEREMATVHDDKPRVNADVRRIPGIGIEYILFAIFEWTNRERQVLLLRREQLPDVPGAFNAAKLTVTALWHEEHVAQWGEDKLLREMWSLPVMANFERELYVARKKRRQRESREANQKLLNDRKEASARRKR
jgi:hypothetical protein